MCYDRWMERYVVTHICTSLEVINIVTCLSDYSSQDSAVGIVTGCRLDDQGVRVRVPVGVRIFISPCHPD
jgi:hypothetical protein